MELVFLNHAKLVLQVLSIVAKVWFPKKTFKGGASYLQ